MATERFRLTFKQYQELTDEQREYHIYQKLDAIDEHIDNFHDDLSKKYAAKWVEKVMIGFIVMILISFAGVIITSVIPGV